MRRTPFAALALAFTMAAGAAEAQTLKIGYINSQQILATAPGAQAANQAFQQDLATYEAEAQQLQDELVRMQQQLEQQQLTLSPEAKRNREQQIQQKAQEAQARMQQLDQRAQQRREQLIQPVMDRISEVIEQIREEGNYSLILDVAAGSIISADPSLDLTDEVLRRLQADGSGTGGAR
ncbi:MAG: OmpH family outer membrane protein [Longimicrobiales bacterium]